MILRLVSKKSSHDIADLNCNRIVTVMYDKRNGCMEIRMINKSESMSFECSKENYNKFLNKFSDDVKKGKGLIEYSL